MNTVIATSIAPWITVPDGTHAIAFYKSAFGAVETYRIEDPENGIVVRLSVDGAEFWISSGVNQDKTAAPLGGDAIRMILTVADPDKVFKQALHAGATEVYPIAEDYGWRIGR